VVREYEYEIHKSLSDGKGVIEKITSESQPTTFETPRTEFDENLSTPSDQPPKPQSDLTQPEGAQPVFRQGPVFIDKIQFLDTDGKNVKTFRRWERLTVRVWYHCEGTIPEETLGLALGIHRKRDLLRVSHFSTIWVVRDSDLEGYYQAGFRKRPGRTGMIEGIIDPIQLAEGEYLVSVGLAPNDPVKAPVQFYEQRYEAYSITIIRDGHELDGLVYYPVVKWNHHPGH
jgi:hypothetical protein